VPDHCCLFYCERGRLFLLCCACKCRGNTCAERREVTSLREKLPEAVQMSSPEALLERGSIVYDLRASVCSLSVEKRG